jgi:hypothetical protein
MTVQTVTVGTTLEVIGPTSVRYDDKVYTDVTLIDFGGGVTKTPEAILTDAGGVTYSASELKACIKIEGTDANANNKQMFTLYSQNSHQTGKNETGAVPGGMWLEMFNFSGDASTNSVLGMWQKYFTSVGTDYKTQYDPAWLGFRMNYGTIARHSYVLTYIDDFNQESVPCPPSVINATFMQRAGFYGVFRPTPPEQNGNLYLPISDFRLYRSDVTADGQYVYRLCRYVTLSSVMPHENISPFPRGVYSYSATPWTQQFGYIIRDFTGPDEMTSTVLPSVDWDPPPPRSLKGLVAGWNGIMFAYAGNTLYPFDLPHLVPVRDHRSRGRHQYAGGAHHGAGLRRLRGAPERAHQRGAAELDRLSPRRLFSVARHQSSCARGRVDTDRCGVRERGRADVDLWRALDVAHREAVHEDRLAREVGWASVEDAVVVLERQGDGVFRRTVNERLHAASRWFRVDRVGGHRRQEHARLPGVEGALHSERDGATERALELREPGVNRGVGVDVEVEAIRAAEAEQLRVFPDCRLRIGQGHGVGWWRLHLLVDLHALGERDHLQTAARVQGSDLGSATRTRGGRSRF